MMHGRLLGPLAARLTLWRCAEVGRGVVVHGRIWIRGFGKVRLGNRVRLEAGAAPIELHVPSPTSELVLEDDVVVESGASIEAQERVVVGLGTRLGAFCKIMDNNFHNLTGDRTVRPPSVPVVIGAHCDVGAKAILLPGARLEDGVVVRPATVVTRHVAAHTTVAGFRAQEVAR